MAVNLITAWNQHALPESHPAREEAWATDAIERREETRREIYLELSGSDVRIARHTGKDRDDSPQGKARRDRSDMMLLTVGSPEWHEAYDHQLSFTIDGEDFEITQGQLYDNAKRRAEDLQRQIDDAKKRGASAEEIALLQGDLDAVSYTHLTLPTIYSV